MNNNQQKWLFSFVMFLLYLCLNAPLWYKIFNKSRVPYWVFPLVMSIAMFLITRLILIWSFGGLNLCNSASKENFNGLHNVGKSWHCAIQQEENIRNGCQSCAHAAHDCLSNQSCIDASMEKCYNDNNCSQHIIDKTIEKCGNLSTN
jgi:hypothetical protein